MPAKQPKPETMSQARTFDKVVRNAEGSGICPPCAAQLAWAVQSGGGGFSSVKPPCAACQVVMLEWPVVRVNGWRTPAGSLSVPGSWVRSPSTRRTASLTAISGGD